MLGLSLGFTLHQPQISTGGGGGGGGVTIAGFGLDVLEQTTNFGSGDVQITLTEFALSDAAIDLQYNGQNLELNEQWFYDSGTKTITVLYEDPFVTTYDAPARFVAKYPY